MYDVPHMERFPTNEQIVPKIPETFPELDGKGVERYVDGLNQWLERIDLEQVMMRDGDTGRNAMLLKASFFDEETTSGITRFIKPKKIENIRSIRLQFLPDTKG